jgi:multiple sugar transport system permease protein
MGRASRLAHQNLPDPTSPEGRRPLDWAIFGVLAGFPFRIQEVSVGIGGLPAATRQPQPGQDIPAGTARAGLLGRLVGASSVHGARKALWGYLFILPWLLGLLFFHAGPVLASLYLSFTDYDILSAPRWVGLKNYVYAMTGDALFWPSLGRTFYYALAFVPLALLASLLLALLLNRSMRGTTIFRTLFFLPHLTPAAALGILWAWLLNPDLGPINLALQAMGLPPYPFLTDKDTVIPSMVMMAVWTAAGGNGMLIFLAGLQGVPTDLLEAAEIDGAGVWSKFRHVTLPMMTPTIFFNLVLGIIGALQVFTVSIVATGGGPSYGSWFLALHIYQQAFAFIRLGYGSALAWLFLVIVLALTALNFGLSRRWVFYRGDA